VHEEVRARRTRGSRNDVRRMNTIECSRRMSLTEVRTCLVVNEEEYNTKTAQHRFVYSNTEPARCIAQYRLESPCLHIPTSLPHHSRDIRHEIRTRLSAPLLAVASIALSLVDSPLLLSCSSNFLEVIFLVKPTLGSAWCCLIVSCQNFL